MFTGIIEGVGQLARVQRQGNELSVSIHCDTLDFSDVKPGDSIASNGVCLTVTRLTANCFDADVSGETLSRTLFGRYSAGQRINLEKALLPTTRLGGHLVSGHVDGIARVMRLKKTGQVQQIWLTLPAALAKYVALKGSVTIDGVSLTVNELLADSFRLTIVPHTATQTTLTQLSTGSEVHLEVDLIARYLERLVNTDQQNAGSGISMALLAQRGFL